jgi:hypothetical protein
MVLILIMRNRSLELFHIIQPTKDYSIFSGLKTAIPNFYTG